MVDREGEQCGTKGPAKLAVSFCSHCWEPPWVLGHLLSKSAD